MRNNTIKIFEWQKLAIGYKGFTRSHMLSLLRLNELHSFNYLEATVSGIRFKNYVGIVQINDLTIEILPKADLESDENTMKKVLLDMLKVCKKVNIHENDFANVRKKDYNLLEVYFEMYLNEVDQLIRKGLCNQYRFKTENSLSLKGRLDVQGNILKNLVHKERFYTNHQVYDKDHLIHQILRKAINIVVSITKHTYLSSFAHRVSLSFPEISVGNINAITIDSIKLNRKTRGYEKSLKLAKIIIENFSPSISTGNVNMIALLFNMDHLWEEYIFQSLKKESKALNIEVTKESKPLFVEGRYFLKPDIVIKKDGKPFIIDTKWKKPTNDKASSQDLRQIYAYNRYWDAEKGILLYPGNESTISGNTFKDSDNKSDNKYKCGLAFLSIIDQGKLSISVASDIVKMFDDIK